MRTRSTSQALMARISPPRSGWVVERPPINRTRQRSRVSFRLPLTASKSYSNSLLERCFRSFIVLSRVHPFQQPQTPCKPGGTSGNHRQNLPICRWGLFRGCQTSREGSPEAENQRLT
jgi:hypothetical protein